MIRLEDHFIDVFNNHRMKFKHKDIIYSFTIKETLCSVKFHCDKKMKFQTIFSIKIFKTYNDNYVLTYSDTFSGDIEYRFGDTFESIVDQFSDFSIIDEEVKSWLLEKRPQKKIEYI